MHTLQKSCRPTHAVCQYALTANLQPAVHKVSEMLQAEVVCRELRTRRENLAAVITQIKRLIDQVPCHNGRLVLVQSVSDAIVPQQDALHIILEPIPAQLRTAEDRSFTD